MKRNKIWVPEINQAIVETDEISEDLESNEVLIRSRYSHISAGTELACIAGLESFFQIPDTPGYTLIGEIIKKGDDVTAFEIGDLVLTYGEHAEVVKIDITDRWHGVCVKVPKNLDLKQASFGHMGNIAMTALRNSTIELGDGVLVTGLGAIGNLVSQLCQLQGADVIATDIVAQRIEIAKQSGVINTVNASEEDLEEAIQTILGEKGVTTYVDASGSSKVVEQSSKLVAWNGEVILLGSPRAPHQTNITSFLQQHHLIPWNHTLKGALEFTLPTHPDDFNKHSIIRNIEVVLSLMDQGKLNVSPLISHEIKPEEIQSAYDGLRNDPLNYVGVVINWQ